MILLSPPVYETFIRITLNPNTAEELQKPLPAFPPLPPEAWHIGEYFFQALSTFAYFRIQLYARY